MTEKFWKQHKYLKVIVMLLFYPLYLCMRFILSVYDILTDEYYWKEMFQYFNNKKKGEVKCHNKTKQSKH